MSELLKRWVRKAQVPKGPEMDFSEAAASDPAWLSLILQRHEYELRKLKTAKRRKGQ